MPKGSFLAHRYDLAIEECRKTLEMDPNFYPTHVYLGLTYEAKGMYKEAVLELEKAKPENSPFQLGALRHAYAEAGRRAGALKVLDEMKERAKKGYFPPFQVALVYARLGESRLDSLRSDPRFQGLLRRMGLPP